jgi:hypothetical protein
LEEDIIAEKQKSKLQQEMMVHAEDEMDRLTNELEKLKSLSSS